MACVPSRPPTTKHHPIPTPWPSVWTGTLKNNGRPARSFPRRWPTTPSFIRRVYLDVAGRIPRNAEVRQFLDDTSPDKRRMLVEELLKETA